MTFGQAELEPRYTPIVDQWRARSVSVVLVAVLAGAPAAAILCASWCSVEAHAPTLAGSIGNSVDHHGSPAGQDVAANAAVGVDHAAADHDHHGSGKATVIRVPESYPALTAFSARGCCSSLAQAPRSRAAGRADTSILSTPEPALLHDLALFNTPNGLQAAPGRAAPLGRSSPAHTALVLRI
jgi:hypothetical protein